MKAAWVGGLVVIVCRFATGAVAAGSAKTSGAQAELPWPTSARPADDGREVPCDPAQAREPSKRAIALGLADAQQGRAELDARFGEACR